MDYLTTYPDAFTRYHASVMKLYIDTDAAYLVLQKSGSIFSGFYHLTNTPHAIKRFLGMVQYYLNAKHYGM